MDMIMKSKFKNAQDAKEMEMNADDDGDKKTEEGHLKLDI